MFQFFNNAHKCISELFREGWANLNPSNNVQCMHVFLSRVMQVLTPALKVANPLKFCRCGVVNIGRLQLCRRQFVNFQRLDGRCHAAAAGTLSDILNMRLVQPMHNPLNMYI